MSKQAGKGDSPRPVDSELYRRNYDRIFRKKRQNAGEQPKLRRGRPRKDRDVT